MKINALNKNVYLIDEALQNALQSGKISTNIISNNKKGGMVDLIMLKMNLFIAIFTMIIYYSLLYYHF
jgi:hypothetical protein